MTSVFDLSKCLPPRTQDSWEIVEQRRHYDHRKQKQNNKKVLPMSILVKIRGPPKLVDSYKIAASPRPGDRSGDHSSSCTPLNIAPFDKKIESRKENRGAIVLKPALQQSKQIPGRYFPKPTLTEEQQRTLLSSKQSQSFELDRNRTETSISNPSCKQNKTFPRAATDLYRPTKRNISNSDDSKLFQTRKGFFDQPNDKPNLFTITFRGGGRDSLTRDDFYSDLYTVNRAGSMSRHVSFPQNSNNFRDTLTGTTKILHYRKDVQSAPCGDKMDDHKEQIPSSAS